jgi:hypothetical protein
MLTDPNEETNSFIYRRWLSLFEGGIINVIKEEISSYQCTCHISVIIYYNKFFGISKITLILIGGGSKAPFFCPFIKHPKALF